MEAIKIADEFLEKNPYTSRRPSTIALACIYAASKLIGEPITQHHISHAYARVKPKAFQHENYVSDLYVKEVSIRNACKDIAKTLELSI